VVVLRWPITQHDVRICEDSRPAVVHDVAEVPNVFDTSIRYGRLDPNGFLRAEVNVSVRSPSLL